MSSSASSLFRNVVVATGVTALVFLAVQRDREERAAVSRLGADIQALKETLAESHGAGPSAVTIVAGPSQGLDSASLDAIATRAVRAAAEERSAAALVATEAAAPTGDQLAARASARRTLDGAIAAGRLAPDDVTAMRNALADDDLDGQLEIRRQVAVAINTGRIVPEDPREIFP